MLMSQETVISNLKNLIMGSSTVSFSDQTIEGSITLDSQQKINLIESLMSGDNPAIQENGATFRLKESFDVRLGESIIFVLTIRKTAYHFASYQSFIQNCLTDNALESQTIMLYEDFYENLNNINYLKQPYLVEIIDFVHYLKKQYYTTNEEQFVIFAKSSCEIPIEKRAFLKYLDIVELYKSQSSTHEYFKKINDWLRAIPSNNLNEDIKKSLLVHEEERRTILAGEIYDLVIYEALQERIFKILMNSESLYKGVIHKYALYLDDFKYSKFNEKLTKFANDFLEKVNKNISDLQTQVLAIPMASALLATFKPDSKLLWVTFLAFLIYSLMVLYTTFQQSFNLLTLENQIKDFKKTYVKENDELKEKWNKETHPIFKKICWHKWYMRFVLGFILIVCGVCIYNLANMDESLFIIYLIQELSHNLFNITA